MLIRVLYFIFIVALVRFLLALFRTLFSATKSSRREPEPGPGPGDPTRGKRVIDVEFTEDKNTDSARKGAR